MAKRGRKPRKTSPDERGSPAPIPGLCGRELRNSRTGWKTAKKWAEEGLPVPATPPRYCTQAPLRGRSACKNHGGRSPIGPASPRWRTGERSKWFGETRKLLAAGPLRDGFDAALEEGNLRTLREQIALAAALRQDALARIGSGASLKAWKDAGRLFAEAQRASTAKDPERAGALLEQLGAVLLTGAHSGAAQDELDRRLERERRLRETEAWFVEQERRMVSVDEMLIFARAYADVVLRYLSGEDERRKFAEEMRALATGARPRYPMLAPGRAT